MLSIRRMRVLFWRTCGENFKNLELAAWDERSVVLRRIRPLSVAFDAMRQRVFLGFTTAAPDDGNHSDLPVTNNGLEA